MSLLRTFAASLAAAQAVVGLAPPQSADARLISRRAEGSSVNMVYWSQVKGGHYDLSKLNANDITHLMYAFAKVHPDGSVKLQQPDVDVGSLKKIDTVGGRWREIFEFKQKNPHVKTLISIGGWTNNETEKEYFPKAASTAESRQRFADSATQLMMDGGFDGIDLDWEYPEPEKDEKKPYSDLVLATRKKLDELGSLHHYHFLLTAAISASTWRQTAIDFEKLSPVMDYWYLMAYDYAWARQKTVYYPANLFPSTSNPKTTESGVNTDATVKSMLSRNVPPEKIVMGIPAYAKHYKNVELGGSMSVINHQEPPSVRSLNYNGLQVACDEEVAQCTGINKETKELFIFDTALTVDLKVQYVKEKSLAGTFFWTFNQDFDGPNSLVSTASRALGGLDRSKALLEYPLSRYSNIRRDSKLEKPETTSSASTSSTTSSASESSTTSPASTDSSVSGTASSGFPVMSFSNMTNSLTASSSSSGTSVAPSSSDSAASSSSSAPSSSDSASLDIFSSDPEGSKGKPRILCAAGEQCDQIEEEMTPTFDSDGLVIQYVLAVMVVVDAGCRDAAVCTGKTEASTKTLTEVAYTTLCGAEETPTVATTVTVDAQAAAKPVPITKDGRVANLCAKEMGCQPTAVPVPERKEGSPASGRSGSGPGRSANEGSSTSEASVSEAGVSNGVSGAAKGSADVKVSADMSARVSYGASAGSEASADAPAAALAPSQKCGTVPPSESKAGVPAGPGVSENTGYKVGAVVSAKTGFKAGAGAGDVSQRISAPLVLASNGSPMSGNKTIPALSGTGRQLAGSMWALLPAVAVLVL